MNFWLGIAGVVTLALLALVAMIAPAARIMAQANHPILSNSLKRATSLSDGSLQREERHNTAAVFRERW